MQRDKELAKSIHRNFDSNPEVTIFPNALKEPSDESTRNLLQQLLRDGYVVLPNVLCKEEVAHVRKECERLIRGEKKRKKTAFL